MKEVFKTIYRTSISLIHDELTQLDHELTYLNISPERLSHEKYTQIRDLCNSILEKYQALNRYQKADIDIRLPSGDKNIMVFITDTKKRLRELAYEIKLQRMEDLTQKLAAIIEQSEQSKLKADNAPSANEGNSKPSGRKAAPANK